MPAAISSRVPMPLFIRLLVAFIVTCWIQTPNILAQEPNLLVIQDVRLIDGTGRPPIDGAWVLIQGDRITRISRTSFEVPDGAKIIDGQRSVLLPGLMDMHIHLSGGRGLDGSDWNTGRRALHGFLYSGITTVYDAGNNADFIFDFRERERAGTILSPRIFASGGVVTAPGGHGGSLSGTLINSWPEAIPLLDAHLAHNPDIVKFTFDEHGWGTRPLIPLLDPYVMTQAAAYLNAHGVRTTVHTSHEFRARQAIMAGLNTLAHPIIQGPVSDEFVQLMANSRTPMVSTLTIGEGYSRLVEHPEFLDQPLYRAVYEPSLIERLKGSVRQEYAARAWTTWMKVMTPVAQENLRKIHAANGVIVLGSDQSAGPQSHRELELMVDGGISPLDAIRIGTLNAAVFLGKERELGSIEEGKIADLILLRSDPLVNISNTQDIELVIKGGVIIDREALDLPANR